MKEITISIMLISSLVLSGCSTTVSTKKGHGNGGIPYYLPKPMLIVKEPIEVGRRDYLFAIVQIGGLSHFLYPFEQDIDQSISGMPLG